MDQLFIPMKFIEDKELNHTECIVLAIYRHYTFKSEQHCCTLRNEDICKMTKLNERTLQRIKKHLKELGYIKTDGMNVTYLKEKFNDDGIDKWFCEV